MGLVIDWGQVAEVQKASISAAHGSDLPGRRTPGSTRSAPRPSPPSGSPTSRPPTPNTVVAYRDAYRLNDPPSGVIERFNVHTEESGSVRQRNSPYGSRLQALLGSASQCEGAAYCSLAG